jgi:cell division protein FtsQ
LLPVGALAAATAAAVLVLLSGKPAPPIQPALAEIERVLDAAGLGLTQISLTGQRFTPDSDVFDAVDLASTPTLLSFDSRAAQARIERLAWVERASIERVFPDRIEVHITERTPAAVWQRGTRHYLIDTSGRVLAAVAGNAMLSLPRVAGEGAAAEAARLHSLLAGNPELMRRVEVAERIGERRWNLRLAGGGVIELPADGVAELEALGRAERLIAAGAHVGASEIDLRVPGRALLRSPAALDMEKAAGARVATGGI